MFHPFNMFNVYEIAMLTIKMGKEDVGKFERVRPCKKVKFKVLNTSEYDVVENEMH